MGSLRRVSRFEGRMVAKTKVCLESCRMLAWMIVMEMWSLNQD